MNIQLYRGNLHKVPDVARRWPLSKPCIPLQVFKKALTKRQEALLAKDKSLSEQGCASHAAEGLQTGDKDDHEHEQEHARKRKREDAEPCDMEMEGEEDFHSGDERKARPCAKAELEMTVDFALDGHDDMACDSLGAAQSKLEPSKDGREGMEMRIDDMQITETPDNLSAEKDSERLEAPRTPAAKDEDCTKSIEHAQILELDLAPCKEAATFAARRSELQEQLKQLQETKHQLVQILKQLLISEESKRKNQEFSQYPAPNGMTGTAEITLEQKLGSDMQPADLEEGELDYTRNSGPSVVGSGSASHLSDAHMTTAGPARHFANQQLNKP